jgi:glycosyltransferase involved in cell wall biosynthesis
MLVLNLYNLKSSNGLLYYALDYLETCGITQMRVLVRPEMKESVKRLLPDANVIACSLSKFAREVAIAVARSEFIYTPTSHPLPFISKQLIVVHDDYPFNGRLGTLKRILFKFSLSTSQCTVGYINHSNAGAFLDRMGVCKRRQLFAPNRFPEVLGIRMATLVPSDGKIVVGLLGSDSTKKNYEELFRNVIQQDKTATFRFLAYGHETDYYRALKKAFSDIDLDLALSDSVTVEAFLASVTIVVSVATNEGFGRPIARALVSGVPCLLRDCPVFREFFDGMATFAYDVPALVTALSTENFGRASYPKSTAPPIAVVDAYQCAASFITERAAIEY